MTWHCECGRPDEGKRRGKWIVSISRHTQYPQSSLSPHPPHSQNLAPRSQHQCSTQLTSEIHCSGGEEWNEGRRKGEKGRRRAYPFVSKFNETTVQVEIFGKSTPINFPSHLITLYSSPGAKSPAL
jgi:hypothetical protein